MTKEEIIKSTISLMNTIALSNPELLDTVITNEILFLTMQSLDIEMEESIKKYMSSKQKETIPFEYSSEKELNEEIRKLIMRNLLTNYKLYQIYDKLRESRNINYNPKTDIELLIKIFNQEELSKETTLILEKNN